MASIRTRRPSLLLLAIGAAIGLSIAWVGPGNVPGNGPGIGPGIGPVRAQAASGPSYTVGSLLIEAPWARATPAGAAVGGAYVKITNRGTTPDRLIGGSLPGAASVEVHEVKLANGIMKMRKLPNGLEIKPGESVELKPGGYHLMLMGLKQGLTQGQKIKGTLQFQTAGTVEVEFTIAAIGAPAAGHVHH